MDLRRRVLANMLDDMEILYCGSSSNSYVTLNKSITDYIKNKSHMILVGGYQGGSHAYYVPLTLVPSWNTTSSSSYYLATVALLGLDSVSDTYVYWRLSNNRFEISNAMDELIVGAIPVTT